MVKRYLIIATVLFLLPANANAIELNKPIDCVIGTECFIQQYVDMLPGGKSRDYRCGYLSSDKNQSTDFRLRDFPQMDSGVGVVAAAKGVVIGVRNGIEDISAKDINPASITGRECGNAVVIDHDNGWKTQYCHLKKNSIYVEEGDEVKDGQRLARVGLSGDTIIPHLSFIVRHNDVYIDPFSTKEIESKCNRKKPKASLWSEEARNIIPHVDTAIMGIGFTDKKPSADLARYGRYNEEVLSVDSSVLVFWTDLMGVQPNDILSLEIVDPDGNTVIQHQKNFIESKDMQFYFTGKEVEEDDQWKAGIYTGKLVLLRNINGKNVRALNKSIEVYLR